MSAASAPGTVMSTWRPTPPQRGSFPLDHDHECSSIMTNYLKCLKETKGTNAPGCRALAKTYLKCRMDTGLMEQDSWENLGLPDDANMPLAQSTNSSEHHTVRSERQTDN